MAHKRYKRIITAFVSLLICSLFVTSCKSQGVTSSYANSSENVSTDTSEEGNKPGSMAGEKDAEKRTEYYEIAFEGGSGKAQITSPVEVNFEKDDSGKDIITARFVWNSKNYDYMIVENVRYENETPGENSSFTVAIPGIDSPLTVIGDTTAMSTPHEIEYTITFLDRGAGVSGPSSKPGSGVDLEAGFEADFDDISIAGQTPKGEVKLSYATGFRIEEYEDFHLIQIKNSSNFLLLEEGKSAPANLPGNVTVLQKPLDKTYLVSTSVMDFVREIDAMEYIRMTGTKADDWYIKDAKDAMKRGDILYAGKYRAPDYEKILSENCNLAIENTMIYHNPEVKEKLEEIGIPVMVETSSYESHPLGRLEWIKLYGVLYGKEAEAESYYKRQMDALEPILQQEKTNLTVAFFHVTSSGMINVRVKGDYITKMIELSGGNYVYPAGKGEEESASDGLMSTMNVQPEDFYLAVKDADVIIYNSTIGGEIGSVEELLRKNELFGNFKAVRNREVYCTGQNFFQETTGMPAFMEDLHAVFTKTPREYTYLKKLK